MSKANMVMFPQKYSIFLTFGAIFLLNVINTVSFYISYTFSNYIENDIGLINIAGYTRFLLLNTVISKIGIISPTNVTSVIETITNFTSTRMLQHNIDTVNENIEIFLKSTHHYNDTYITGFLELMTDEYPSVEEMTLSYLNAFEYQDTFTQYIVKESLHQIHVVQIIHIGMLCMIILLTMSVGVLFRQLNTTLIRDTELSTEKTAIAFLCHEMKSSILPIEMTVRDIADNEYLQCSQCSQCEPHCEIKEKTKYLLSLIQEHNYMLTRRLDFTKIINTRYNINDERFDIIKLLEEIIEHTPHPSNVNLQLICPFNEVWIESDNFIINTIIVNLVKNAIKYTNEGHVHVVVTFDYDTRYVEIQVSDTGIGMSDEVKDNFFNKIHSNSYNQSYGIGISIVSKMCAVLKHSSVELVSSKQNEGTTVLFKFMSNSMISAYRSRNNSYSGGDVYLDIEDPITVFIVDDCRIIRRCFKHLFEKHGWIVTEFCNGEELLSSIMSVTRHLPDVIIIDEHMQQGGGVMKGTEVICKIKHEYSFQGYIIHMSGSTVKNSIADVVWDKPPPKNNEIIATITESVLSRRKRHNTDVCQQYMKRSIGN